VKQSEAKFEYIFLFFSLFSLFFAIFRIFSLFFSLFFAFFAFFRFKFFALLRFSHFCFEAKQSEAKFKNIFSFFFTFFRFFSLFSHFFTFFPFASIFSLNFRLFYLRFCFRFLVFRIEVKHVKSDFFFAYKRNEIFTSISNFAFEAQVRANPNQYIPSPCKFMISFTLKIIEVPPFLLFLLNFEYLCQTGLL
jgi:hypothetical protein